MTNQVGPHPSLTQAWKLLDRAERTSNESERETATNLAAKKLGAIGLGIEEVQDAVLFLAEAQSLPIGDLRRRLALEMTTRNRCCVIEEPSGNNNIRVRGEPPRQHETKRLLLLSISSLEGEILERKMENDQEAVRAMMNGFTSAMNDGVDEVERDVYSTYVHGNPFKVGVKTWMKVQRIMTEVGS